MGSEGERSSPSFIQVPQEKISQESWKFSCHLPLSSVTYAGILASFLKNSESNSNHLNTLFLLLQAVSYSLRQLCSTLNVTSIIVYFTLKIVFTLPGHSYLSADHPGSSAITVHLRGFTFTLSIPDNPTSLCCHQPPLSDLQTFLEANSQLQFILQTLPDLSYLICLQSLPGIHWGWVPGHPVDTKIHVCSKSFMKNDTLFTYTIHISFCIL